MGWHGRWVVFTDEELQELWQLFTHGDPGIDVDVWRRLEREIRVEMLKREQSDKRHASWLEREAGSPPYWNPPTIITSAMLAEQRRAFSQMGHVLTGYD